MQRNVIRNFIGSAAVLAGLWLTGSIVHGATTWTVGPDGSGKDYTSIQAAINGATADGDAIEIYTGTYVEKLTVDNSKKRRLTIRAAAGEHPVLSPTNMSSTAITFKGGYGHTCQGLEITGTNVAAAISVYDCPEFRILDNTIHHLRTNASCQAIRLANYGLCTNGVVAGNVIRDLGDGNDSGCEGVYSYYAPAGWLHGGPRSIEGLVFSNNVIDNLNYLHPSTAVQLFSPNMTIVNNVSSRCRVHCNYGDFWIGGDNVVFARNRIHDPVLYSGAEGTSGLVIKFGSGVRVVGNRITANRGAIELGGPNDSYLPTQSPTNVICIDNVIDTVMAVNTWYSSVNISKTADCFFSNNVVLSSHWALSLQSTVQNTEAKANTFICIGGSTDPAADANVTPLLNAWNGNFYSYDKTGTDTGTGDAAPYTVGGAAGAVDTSARPGCWAMAGLGSGSGTVPVGLATDTNQLGQRTKLTYDASRCAFVAATNKASLIHLRVDRHAGTAGLPKRQTLGLGRTLQMAHTLADGGFFATLQLAFDPADVAGCDASTLDLFAWNMEDIDRPRWKLAVAGNVTNAAFPANDICRIDGPPDAVLGHYGVDTAGGIVWANINHTADFAVFARPKPVGTALLVR